MTREVRCPMPECRLRIDLDELPPEGASERDSCMHFIAAWGGARGTMVEETMRGLDGNREFLIRNIRPDEYGATELDSLRTEGEAAIDFHGHIVDGVALFGDLFQRDGIARALAQLVLGADPIARRG
jgi:hypothetical protein